MNINTGKTPITAMTLAAILSLSLIVNLPGLAVTPMLSTLSNIFPNTTQIEKQLLTVLPNLLIIPFVLLSGKLSLSHHKRTTIIIALILFVASAAAYLFAKSMMELIIISCLLGCGAGLLIPFSTGLIADCFVGKQRMKMMGFQSGISNMTLVIATFAVGWLSAGNWHLPFVVYLVGIVPLLFAFKLGGIPNVDLQNPNQGVPQQAVAAPVAKQGKQEKVWRGFYVDRMIQLISVYFFISFAVMIISYYCPFLVEKEHWSDTLSGTITSLFFLFIFLPGFFLTKLVKTLKGTTFIVAGAFMLAGMAIFGIFKSQAAMCIGASLAGLGYGMCQPMLYDKASRAVVDQRKSTMALAVVLASNYISIVLTPFIVDFMREILHAQHVNGFAFYLSAALLAIYFSITIFKKQSFVFSVDKAYYE